VLPIEQAADFEPTLAFRGANARYPIILCCPNRRHIGLLGHVE